MLQFVGDRISRIEAKREEKIERPLDIESSLKLTAVEKKGLFSAGKEIPGLIVKFEFLVSYGKTSGNIVVEGAVFIAGEETELKDLEAEWKKKKRLDSNVAVPVLNKAMELGYVSAIQLAREVRLPVPLNLPKVRPETMDKKEKAAA